MMCRKHCKTAFAVFFFRQLLQGKVHACLKDSMTPVGTAFFHLMPAAGARHEVQGVNLSCAVCVKRCKQR